ncbi:Alpha/Beta hydrolase protein [Cyathus striatus]|nr:Alpha/Beta hydrolase protein [Cyathus striatus]
MHLLPLLLSPLLLAAAQQQAFSSHKAYDADLFTPVESLTLLSEDAFTTLSHPLFPNYNVRVKKSRFCDTTVNAYTGYIDIQARHLFFYFFESRSNPDTDDVIFWTNGGPGCSSSLGLFMELGPCRVINNTEPIYHPESWNTNANVFFIDQPVGVGFSYAEYGETVSTTEEAAQDIAAFVAIFFEHFSQFKGRAFHMAGESYAGRYLPLFASAVYDQNAKLVAAGMTPVNLTSVMIGNGMTDSVTMFLSYYDMQCTSVESSLGPVVDISSCVAHKALLPRCERWLKQSCEDKFDAIDCGAASEFCMAQFVAPYYATNLNPYDMSKPCPGSVENSECYTERQFILDFLDKASVRKAIGVDPSVPRNFSSCNDDINQAFLIEKLDIMRNSKDYITALLERDIRVLIYVGTYDWICNHVGNERWTLALEWSGKDDFVKAEKRKWFVNGKQAGHTRSAGKFTFATIDGAGHLVPFDKPKESLAMVQRWLAGESL